MKRRKLGKLSGKKTGKKSGKVEKMNHFETTEHYFVLECYFTPGPFGRRLTYAEVAHRFNRLHRPDGPAVNRTHIMAVVNALEVFIFYRTEFQSVLVPLFVFSWVSRF